MFWSKPPCDRQGSLAAGAGDAGQVVKTSKPSLSSDAPVSLGSEPGTRSRESVQAVWATPPSAKM